MALSLAVRYRNDPLVKLRLIEMLLRKNEPMAIGFWDEYPDSKDSNFLRVSVGWKSYPTKTCKMNEMDMFYELRKFKDDPDIQFIWESPVSSIMNQGWM